jgi:hypothetical protein
MSSSKSVSEIYAEVKRGAKPIADLTRSDIIHHCDRYRRPAWLLAQLRNLATNEANPPKPRRKRTRRKPRRDTGRRKPRRASAVFHSQMQAAATLELVERVNDAQDTEVDDNPLQLLNTQPGLRYPTYAVVRPGDANYRQPEASTAPMVPGVDY